MMKTEAKRKVTIAAVKTTLNYTPVEDESFKLGARASRPPFVAFRAARSCGRDARAPSDLSRAKPCATERPVFRPGAQFGFDRIVFDVPDRGCEVFRVANVAIKILFKPELPAAAQHLVRFRRSERLERV